MFSLFFWGGQLPGSRSLAGSAGSPGNSGGLFGGTT